MVGYECNIFVNLNAFREKGLAIDELKCGICLSIMNRAVTTICGHTYCHSCLTEWLTRDHNTCPQCQHKLIKHFYTKPESNNVVIIGGYICHKNLMANNIISKLRVKCKFAFNGCPDVIPLEQLSTHLKTCDHQICKTCGYCYVYSAHNCVDVLTAKNNELKHKLNKLKNSYRLMALNESIDKTLYNILKDEMNSRTKVLDECRRRESELEMKCKTLEKRLKESDKKFKELLTVVECRDRPNKSI